MAFISYAQNFEDIMLWRALRDVEAGNYLDVGAQDPVIDSVSRAFYDAGWRGIHVEPTPNYNRALRENRPDELVIKAVVSANPGLRAFYEIPGTGLSTGVEEIAEQHRAAGWEVVQRTVPSIPLASLLDQFEGKDIHWLKIDVEGMELDVLRSWGDHPARPWVLVIESTFPNTQEPTHHAWINQVTGRGYREVYFDGLSRYFLAETQIQREAAFATPPNVFDQFHVERHHFSSGLVRQSEEAMQQRMAETEQKATEQEQRHQLELVQLEEASGQREALSQEQIAHLQHALHEHELAQDRFRSAIGEKEGELAALRQQLEQLHANHHQAIERFQSDRIRDDQAHRAHIEGLEAALSVAQAAMDRLGLELDRRDADLHTALDALRDAAKVHEDRELEHRHVLQSLEKALEQGQAEAAKQAARLNGATILLLELQSDQLLRKRWLNRPTIDAAEFSALKNRIESFLSQSVAERAAVQQDTLDCGSKSDTGRNMSMDISSSNAGRARTLDELLEHHDLAFVRCAYRTILGREPDAAGEAYYLARLRSGIAKLHILRQLRRCDEASRHDPGIAGLDKALRKDRWLALPLIGPIAKLSMRNKSPNVTRQLRILANEIGMLENRQVQLQRILISCRYSSEADIAPSMPDQSASEWELSPEVINNLPEFARDRYMFIIGRN